MTGIKFTPSSSRLWLYLADDEQADVVFLLPPDTENLPAQLDMVESWTEFFTGCYVFLPGPLDDKDQAAFADAAWVFLNDPTRRERPRPDVFLPRIGPRFLPRFAWFANPEQAAAGLRGQSISLYRPDELSEWRNDRLVTCDFDDYTLQIVKNATISPKADGSGFDFLPPAGFDHTFLTPEGRLSVEISLAMGGQESGAFIISADDITNSMHKLEPEIRYFFQDARVTSMGNDFSITSLRYPILSQRLEDWDEIIGKATGFLSLHLLKPMVSRGIDLFKFLRGIRLPSLFHTNLGHPVHLTPLEGSKLIFVPRPDFSRDETGSRTHYATLEGDFEISVSKTSSAPDNLICGLSGAEYIRLSPGQRNILTFVPGKPAFAPAFRVGQSQDENAGEAANGEKLTSLATTAWVCVSQLDPTGTTQSGPIYYAQPDKAVLYQPSQDLGSGDFLKYMEVPATALPSQVAAVEPPLAFPLAPYGKVESDLIENYQKFEKGLLSPVRRSLIYGFTPKDGETPLPPLIDSSVSVPEFHVGTTPQGLLATYSGNFETLNSLVLAHDSAGRNLEFKDISRIDPLRSALQSSQLFLVITNPASIQDHFNNQSEVHATILDIAGWKFDLDPAKWEKYQTILIFKFHNHSLQELATSTQAWTLAEEFSANPEADCFRLDMFIQDALARVPLEESASANPQDSENYRQLALAARNPSWTGILAINIPIPDGGLPQEIAGLASGIDSKRFFAQYAGIESSTVRLEGSALEIQESSLFGLIDYVDTGGTIAAESDYNFYVSKLNVLFQNSQIKLFAGEVVVTLDKLFGEEVRLQNSLSGRNEIHLVGRCESHDGRNTYSFSSGDVSKFDLPESGILNEVEIVKAQFSTDPPANASEFVTGEKIISRFSFWGRLDFQKVEAFDILSFGNEPRMLEGGGLRFSNLQLVSTFQWGKATAKEFAFSAGALIFDQEKSQARVNSLFAKFPLKLIGLVEVDGEKNKTSPDSLGYMPVRTPAKGEKPQSGETWYGLVYDLNLGSAGALAGKAGIVVSVLAAWKPGAGQNVYTGLRMPGSSGGKKEIPIQGILKIAFKSIEFQVLDGDQVGYLLKLKNIVLKFMTLELPPNAQSEIIIFGNPEGETKGGENTLAWYAAYARESSPQAQKKLPKDMVSTRRE